MWFNWQFVSGVLKIIFRHPVIGVTLVPILPNGKIVFVYRRDCEKWGLDLMQMKRLIGVYSSPKRDPRLHSISVLIEVEVKGQIHIQDTWEIGEVKAFSLDEIPMDNLAHDHARQLQDYLQGKTAIA